MASSFSSPKLIHGFHGPNSCSCIPHFHTIKLGSNRPQTPLSFRAKHEQSIVAMSDPNFPLTEIKSFSFLTFRTYVGTFLSVTSINQTDKIFRHGFLQFFPLSNFGCNHLGLLTSYVLKLIPIKFGTDKVLRSSMALISLCLLGYMFVLNIVTILMCSFGLLFTTLQISQAPPRFRDAARLQLRTRLYTVFASNSSPSDGDSSEEKSGGTISSDDARGAAFQVDRILYCSFSEQKVDFYSTRTQETTYVRSLDM
ncbi:hypothetical protein POTOM_005335 [Populus tomentosa]|uniref:Uncharacterized protein n=1 Tax=Populus tomentosa TaxID=118781 RepID=A0A8X8DE25_POPTO|nr:hypothetical protein POTOM_005335 [Populus tomentosa]